MNTIRFILVVSIVLFAIAVLRIVFAGSGHRRDGSTPGN